MKIQHGSGNWILVTLLPFLNWMSINYLYVTLKCLIGLSSLRCMPLCHNWCYSYIFNYQAEQMHLVEVMNLVSRVGFWWHSTNMPWTDRVTIFFKLYMTNTYQRMVDKERTFPWLLKKKKYLNDFPTRKFLLMIPFQSNSVYLSFAHPDV